MDDKFWRQAARFQRQQLWWTRVTSVLCTAFLLLILFMVMCK